MKLVKWCISEQLQMPSGKGRKTPQHILAKDDGGSISDFCFINER